ncbi:MAG: type IV pilus biogenesis/stability protein PilW [Limnobacter sp.]|nr:type IV pilus biogenesis/stability protein PilW [Limnobacter sp.]
MRVAVAIPALLSAALLLGACAAPSSSSGPGAEGLSTAVGGKSVAAGSVVPGSAEETDAQRRARIRVELAANYYQEGQLQVALGELGQALAADPANAPAYGMLGLVYMQMGDTPRAEESFQRALRLAPDDADLNNNYGWFLCRNGREREAIDRFGRALRDPLYKTPAKALHNAGICSLRIGDEAGAERYLQRAFQLDASNPVTMFNLSELYLKRRDYDRARFYAQRLLGAFEPVPQTLWLALKIEHALGNREAVASLGAQLRRRFPASPEAGLLAAGRYSD